MAKKIPLADWAAMHYDPPPSAWTLRQWVRAARTSTRSSSSCTV